MCLSDQTDEAMSKKTKSQRLAVIADLLRSYEVPDQATLLELLRKRDIFITQGTLSTYLSELGATKGVRPGSYKPCYQLPRLPQSDAVTEQPLGLISPTVGFRSYALSGQLLVIRTEPGFAQSIATILDGSTSSLSLGSVAGYDTIIVALAEEATRAEVIDWLHRLIPESILAIAQRRPHKD